MTGCSTPDNIIQAGDSKEEFILCPRQQLDTVENDSENTLSNTWKYSDVRATSTQDDAKFEPELAAIYLRQTGDVHQVRLDFLDLTQPQGGDLYLAIDDRPGGIQSLPIDASSSLETDTVVKLTSNGIAQVLAPRGEESVCKIALDIVQNQKQGSLVFSVAGKGDTRWGIQVCQASHDESEPPRCSRAVWSDDPPPAPARLLLAFWDVMPAANPVQAVRRWNGAHTGPYGERHGLKHLLEIAAEYKTPIALLDLKHPAALSALDYLGVLPQIKEMADQGLLILPDISWGDPAYPKGIDISQKISASFGIGPNPFQISSRAHSPSQYQITIGSAFSTPDDELVIPVIKSGVPELSREGLSLESRELLRNAAQPGDPGHFAVLGGSLPRTPWGDPNSIRAALDYIYAHPWIKVMSQDDLSALPGNSHQALGEQTTATDSESAPGAAMPLYSSNGELISTGLNSEQLEEQIRNLLDSAPDNPLTEIAQLTYLNLTGVCISQPMCDQDKYPMLRAQYLGYTGHIIEAARWADDPENRSSCDTDPDFDGVDECIMSSEKHFFLFEPDGARLVFAASITDEGPIQWIAPSFQFTTGRSDPVEWRPESGTAGDPDAIPGAFYEEENTWTPFDVSSTIDQITFSSHGGLTKKVFTIRPNGLTAEIHTATPMTSNVALSVDPTGCTLPGWRKNYSLATLSNGWQWGKPDFRVSLSLGGSIQDAHFLTTETSPLLDEDPNREVDPGNFLPLPMSFVSLKVDGNYRVDLTVQDEDGTVRQ